MVEVGRGGLSELEQLEVLHAELLLQLDAQDRRLQRLRWWLLCHALLLLALAIVVLELR